LLVKAFDNVIVIENWQKIIVTIAITTRNFKTFKLQLQQNRVINYKFFNYNYNFSNPAVHTTDNICSESLKKLQIFRNAYGNNR